MLNWIRLAFQMNLPNISWMDNTTRIAAAEKAALVYLYVASPPPQGMVNYTLTMDPNSYYYNQIAIREFTTRLELLSLTTVQPARPYWPSTISPLTVNCQYNRGLNIVTFPAAILQTPFFNASWPMAMNLGSIGMLMGHEFLHGFDNNGREYDGHGVRRNWWPADIVQNFIVKSQCLIYQYGNITVQGTNIDGVKTLPENIADNGGLHTSFLAYQYYLNSLSNKTEKLPPTTPPLTANQLFYVAHAQTWCQVASDEGIKIQVRDDVHSPGIGRVNGPLVNSPDFAAAFNCPINSPMNPEKKCDLY